MFTRLLLGVLAICFFVGSAAANTLINYSLSGNWTYESDSPGTLSLSDNPAGGITVDIDIPTGLEEGGLSASQHVLTGFSLGNRGFVELAYGDLSSTITGSTASLGLIVEVEFYDVSSVRHQIAMGIWQENGKTGFDTWFERDDDFDHYSEVLVPNGLSIEKGALGLYSDGLRVLPYFTDDIGGTLYPFAAWDISGVSGIHTFSVDNDFEGDSTDGGTVIASVNLRHVEYGATGDANGDGFVDDDDDLSLLLANWGQDTDWAHGEFSGETPVDDNDLSLLLANWTGSAPAATTVPEPASLALLALGGLAVLRRRRS
jgi:hypothetical protein